MFIKPDFIQTNEEWIVWLLGEEFHQSASPEALSERTHLPLEQTIACIGNLERAGAAGITRDAETKRSITSVRLTPYGKSLFSGLKKRSTED
jgi:hypothetical protein